MQYLIAPALIIAALMFVYVYQDNRTAHDSQRARHQVEMQKFNRDFADAWNGDTIQKPDAQELEAARARLAQAEQQAEAQREATKSKLDQLGTELDAELHRRTQSQTND